MILGECTEGRRNFSFTVTRRDWAGDSTRRGSYNKPGAKSKRIKFSKVNKSYNPGQKE